MMLCTESAEVMSAPAAFPVVEEVYICSVCDRDIRNLKSRRGRHHDQTRNIPCYCPGVDRRGPGPRPGRAADRPLAENCDGLTGTSRRTNQIMETKHLTTY